MMFELNGWKWESEPMNRYESYYAHYTTYGVYGVKLWPFYYLNVGFIVGGTLNKVSNEGRYWSSTAFTDNDTYRLLFNYNQTIPSGYNDCSLGFPIRCFAR